MANITASSQRSPLQYSRKDYGIYSLSANQTTGIADTNPIKFNTVLSGNIAFNPATYTWTLKANKTYKLMTIVSSAHSAAGYILFYWKDITNSVILSNIPEDLTVSSTGHETSSNTAMCIVTPITDINVQVLIANPVNLNSITASETRAEITELDTYTPAVYGGQYAYVSPPILLTVTGTNYVSVRAVGIFYKTTNGTWRMTFNLTGTMTATNSRALTIAGVVFKNTTEYYQSVSSHSNANTVYNTHAYCNPNAGTIQYTFSNNTTVIRSSGDVELDSKPTVAGIPADV